MLLFLHWGLSLLTTSQGVSFKLYKVGTRNKVEQIKVPHQELYLALRSYEINKHFLEPRTNCWTLNKTEKL